MLALLALLFVVAPLHAQETPAAPDAPAVGSPTEPMPEEAAPAQDPVVDELARVNERIAALDEEIAAIESTIDPSVQPPSPIPRLDFLKRSKLLNQRRVSALTRILQLEEQLAPPPPPMASEADEKEDGEAKPSRGGAPEEDPEPELPPIDIKAFDTLLDQIDAAQRQATAAQEVVVSQEKAARRAVQFHEEAARARRAAEEAHAAAVAAGDGLAEYEQLEVTRQAEALAETQMKVEEVLVRVAKLEVQLAERGVVEARKVVTEAATRLTFTPEALAEITQGLEAQRTDLSAKLDELYKLREKNAEARYRARENADAAPPEEVETKRERVTTAETILGATTTGIQNLEERMANLQVEEDAWAMRAKIMNDSLEGSLVSLLRENTQKLGVIRETMSQVQSRARNTLSARLDTDRRLDNPELIPELRASLTRRLEALDLQEGYDRDYVADLTRQEKLLRRVEWSLNNEITSVGYMAQFAEAQRIFFLIWDYELFVYEERGFTVSSLGFALIAYVAMLTGLLSLRRFLRRRFVKLLAKRAGSDNAALRDAGLTFISGTSTLVMVILSLWPTLQFLPLSDAARSIITTLLFLALIYQIALYATNWMERALNRHKMRRMKEDPSSVSAYGVVSFFARIAVWTVLLLFSLNSFGVDITTVVAGLGVGGIAVAFALQSILADIFSSVAILLDKPFAVGDFIKVGEQMGEVENIGLKTTRVKSLSGEQLVISNTDLLGSRIQNFKRMAERRSVFTIGVTYQTTVEQLEAIPAMLQEAVELHELARFDRAHFSTYGDFALIFECVYYVLSNDYKVYMDIHQAINLNLFRRFAENGIEFAYPTQTLYLHMAGAEGPSIEVTAKETGDNPSH